MRLYLFFFSYTDITNAVNTRTFNLHWLIRKMSCKCQIEWISQEKQIKNFFSRFEWSDIWLKCFKVWNNKFWTWTWLHLLSDKQLVWPYKKYYLIAVPFWSRHKPIHNYYTNLFITIIQTIDSGDNEISDLIERKTKVYSDPWQDPFTFKCKNLLPWISEQ